jgi:hypothetical protein
MSGKGIPSLRAVKKVINELEEGLTESKISDLIKGGGKPGGRFFPSKTPKNDAKPGGRLDNGEVFKEGGLNFRNVYLQANKEAANPSLKAFAQNNSHATLAAAKVQLETEEETKAPDVREKRRQKTSKLFQDLTADAERRANEDDKVKGSGQNKKK